MRLDVVSKMLRPIIALLEFYAAIIDKLSTSRPYNNVKVIKGH